MLVISVLKEITRTMAIIIPWQFQFFISLSSIDSYIKNVLFSYDFVIFPIWMSNELLPLLRGKIIIYPFGF